MYDYLIVGSGLYGAVFAHEAKKLGKKVLVIDKRTNIAGNIYTENVEGINVHKYGAHIFHTNNKKVWNYITQFAEFNRFTNSPVANYKGELYSLPFNMYTFNKMWGVVTPEEAIARIEEQRKEIKGEPKNLEEQAVSLVGRDIYEKLIKGYTEKQWGRDCKEVGCLAGTGQHTGGAALQFGNLGGDGIAGGVLQAGIKITAGLQVKQLAHIVGAIIFESGALHNGNLAGFAVAGGIAALYAQGIDAVFAGLIHDLTSFPQKR